MMMMFMMIKDDQINSNEYDGDNYYNGSYNDDDDDDNYDIHTLVLERVFAVPLTYLYLVLASVRLSIISFGCVIQVVLSCISGIYFKTMKNDLYITV